MQSTRQAERSSQTGFGTWSVEAKRSISAIYTPGFIYTLWTPKINLNRNVISKDNLIQTKL